VESLGVSPAEILTVVSLPFVLVSTVVVARRRRVEAADAQASGAPRDRRRLDGRVSLDGR
jgi:hypothetical protein